MEKTGYSVEVVSGTPTQMKQFQAVMQLAGKEITPVVILNLDGTKIIGYEVKYPQPVSK